MEFSTISPEKPPLSSVAGQGMESVLDSEGSSEEISQSEGISEMERDSLLLLLLEVMEGGMKLC